MTDTPRTDDRVLYAEEIGANTRSEWVNAPFARGLERELNEANARIKRLEEAGNQLKDRYILENENWDLQTVNEWNEAKEAKP